MAAPNVPVKNDGQRGEHRTAIGRTAILRVHRAEPVEVLLADITRNGCRILTARDLAPGDAVTVGIAGVGPVDGRVIWRDDHGYGCRFDAELAAGACTAAARENVVRIGADGVDMPPRSRPAYKYTPRVRMAILTACWSMPWLGIGAAVLLLS